MTDREQLIEQAARLIDWTGAMHAGPPWNADPLEAGERLIDAGWRPPPSGDVIEQDDGCGWKQRFEDLREEHRKAAESWDRQRERLTRSYQLKVADLAKETSRVSRGLLACERSAVPRIVVGEALLGYWSAQEDIAAALRTPGEPVSIPVPPPDELVERVAEAIAYQAECVDEDERNVLSLLRPSARGEYRKEARAAIDAIRSGRPERCPRCDSPDPDRHPAVQFEGEVQVCPHAWHLRAAGEGQDG